MKKKLAKLNPRVQIALVVVGLLLVLVVGYEGVISPAKVKTAKLQAQAMKTETKTATRAAALRRSENPPKIQVANLFRLTRAMPDTVDMPGLILTLSEVASQAGIQFASIQPETDGAPTLSDASVLSERIELTFSGSFFGLSDFLYRLRNLVVVRNGTLDATGRLFDVDTVNFTSSPATFPTVSADLYVDAYVYSAAAAVPAAPAVTDTTTDSSTDGTTTTPDSTDSTDSATADGTDGATG